VKDKKESGSKPEFSGSVKIGDLVGYQEGSVVSRTIIDKKSGTVTLFAFDKGEGLSEHISPYEALIYLIDGEAEVAVAGQSSVLRKGDAILLPARKPHALKAKESFKMLLVMIR
jgi:quercetin dioxygenase-like cupin family protein